ncbi:oligopeptide/dipeptide ABC transporter, ATPase subunit [Desulfofarcimen acetoxidans DSM 771]|uniref:Oligopeptide/dipeptide ABC transporter, ATPase subunit n=1 Tax=Desulfofarcimen acetoxidans (strain ATCC 49208 / DSM 771 / KCTC 5769 / VKM B-1644 / 5575) TaxID=485916 RepID=C8W4U7_DESAS|nr:ABC transporter ATP-binding protein [Desulfofarcimen acetoxidans]ACV61299.1 oligopeptide/dipeptide ABC transporter, ATPase subunit [Desulfofarcimen acetoxidans DSM 771]
MLSISNLKVRFGERYILDGINLEIPPGQILALIGESGAGKTTLGRTILRLHDGVIEGNISWNGIELVNLPEEDMRQIRWNSISMVFQNAGEALNPVITVLEQVAEPLLVHARLKKKEARAKARLLLAEAGLPLDRVNAYPPQLSGGEKQRAVIAMALANSPELIILDEPTAAMDGLTRREILELLKRTSEHCAMLLVTHDLSAAAALADHTAVLYDGKIIEAGATGALLEQPGHPYTRGLLRSYPNMTTTKDMQGIKGKLEHCGSGCRFANRCTQAREICASAEPDLNYYNDRQIACHRGGIVPLLQISNLDCHFGPVKVVDGVNLTVFEGETLALVGQSGSGKTTLAATIMGILQPKRGNIVFDEINIGKKRDRSLFKQLQMIFQNPSESISHRATVLEAVREPLDIQNIGSCEERIEKVRRVLEEVQLSSDDTFLGKYPHHLSGGEAQRVAIARAMILQPKLIVADEPTSALDASVQAKILKLLLHLQEERGLALLFITHDIALARKVSDRIAVMRSGRIIEEGLSSRITSQPQNDYTRELLSAAPSLENSLIFEETGRNNMGYRYRLGM